MSNPGSDAMSAFDTSVPAPPPGEIRPPWRRSLGLIGVSFVLAYAFLLTGWAAQGFWLVDRAGQAIANDFVNVWAAGKLALEGQPAAAYDWAVHREVEVAAVEHDFDGYYGWHYPPTFLFVAAPLAALPYLTAALVWLAVTLPAYMLTIRSIIGERLGLLLACAFPGVIWNISAGQNGFLTAALIGGMLINLERRPILAGVFLGLLTYKPQFGILFPVVLVFDGRWRVIAAAVATASALGAAALLTFGLQSWQAFVEWMPVTSAVVFGDGRAGLNKLQSLFGVVRWLGGGMTAAWLAQGVFIAVLAAAVVALWRRSVSYEIKAAALAVAALLATPYLYIYDFPVLAIPLAFLVRAGQRDGFLAYEWPALAAACGLILAFPFLVMPTGFAAAVIVAATIACRVFAAPGSQAHAATQKNALA